MNNEQRKILIEQLDRKIGKLPVLQEFESLSRGWIYTIRTALHMSLNQLAKRMKKSRSTVQGYEAREVERTITLHSLMETAEALDCHFVYGLVPKNGTLNNTIEKRALQLAKEIVARSSQSMMLEDQVNSSERLQNAIKVRAEQIKNELPKYLWD
ncbi:MAG: mobile mystery protein A [Ignavibacteriales bacterium]|nr:mobile mystery protein A [Ignavibacteriales bacterium]